MIKSNKKTAKIGLIPWMGGKFKLRREVISRFCEHRTYVEVFFGGGAILFNSNPAHAEVINDINSELINLYKIVKYHKEALIHELRYDLASRETFNLYLQHKGLTDIQRAARFYYRIKASYGGKAEGQTYGYSVASRPKFNPLTFETVINEVSARLARVNVENTDWQDIIKRYDRPDTLFYLDPPYHNTAGYGIEFDDDQYVRMSELMRSSKGKFCVSLNDCDFVRQVFSGHNMHSVDIFYTLAGKHKGKISKELIITNY